MQDPTATDASASTTGDAGITDAGDQFLDFLKNSIARQRTLAERALDQVSDDAFFPALGEDGNSLAVLVKHLGGNLRSRFTDFLTTDGEKPDRHRDREFIIEAADSRDRLMAAWREGWSRLESALAGLSAQDLDATVTIRGERYGVIEALLRCHDHVGYHVGQIVQLARYHVGDAWQTLSIARGGSDAYAAAVQRGEASQRAVSSGEEI